MNNKCGIGVYVCVLLYLLAGCTEISALEWLEDFNAALRDGKIKKQFIFVDVYSDTCEYCGILHKKIYPAPKIKNQMQKFVSLKINGELNEELMQRYEVNGFPTILFIDKNGYLMERLDGLVSEDRLVQKMRDVLSLKDIEDSMNAILAKNPDDAFANFRLGLYYGSIRKHLKSIEYFSMVYRSNNLDAKVFKWDSLYNIALSSMELKEMKNAFKYWNIYIQNVPEQKEEYVYSRYYRGISAMKIGEKEKAIEDLTFAAKYLNRKEERQSASRYLNIISKE